jgi:hypothetical protein
MWNIHFTRRTYFRRLLWALLTLNVVISRFLYLPVTSFPPHSSMLNTYQLHKTSSEGHKVLMKYEQMLKLAHITWLPIFSEFPVSKKEIFDFLNTRQKLAFEQVDVHLLTVCTTISFSTAVTWRLPAGTARFTGQALKDSPYMSNAP